jgi:hypothetical protein
LVKIIKIAKNMCLVLYLGVSQFVPLRGKIVSNTLIGPRKGDSSAQKDKEHDIRHQGCDPDSLLAKREVCLLAHHGHASFTGACLVSHASPD